MMSIPGCSTEKRILRHLEVEDAKLIRSGLSTEGDESSEPILLMDQLILLMESIDIQ